MENFGLIEISTGWKSVFLVSKMLQISLFYLSYHNRFICCLYQLPKRSSLFDYSKCDIPEYFLFMEMGWTSRQKQREQMDYGYDSLVP